MTDLTIIDKSNETSLMPNYNNQYNYGLPCNQLYSGVS